MGLLSDIAIKEALNSGALQIKPEPKPEDFDSDSLDVHLGEKIYTWLKPAGGAEFTIPLWRARTEPGSFDYLQLASDYLVRVQPDVNDGVKGVVQAGGSFRLLEVSSSRGPMITAVTPDEALAEVRG